VAEKPPGYPNYVGYRFFLHLLRADKAVRTEDPNAASLFLIPAQT